MGLRHWPRRDIPFIPHEDQVLETSAAQLEAIVTLWLWGMVLSCSQRPGGSEMAQVESMVLSHVTSKVTFES